MLAHDNKYLKGYWFICNQAMNRVLPDQTYVEKHHIYPKSIYGPNNDIVKLTAKEHYLVHKMLYKFFLLQYGESHKHTIKMARAFNTMRAITKKQIRCEPTAKDYDLLRQAASIATKNRIVSDQTKQKMSN